MMDERDVLPLALPLLLPQIGSGEDGDMAKDREKYRTVDRWTETATHIQRHLIMSSVFRLYCN